MVILVWLPLPHVPPTNCTVKCSLITNGVCSGMDQCEELFAIRFSRFRYSVGLVEGAAQWTARKQLRNPPNPLNLTVFPQVIAEVFSSHFPATQDLGGTRRTWTDEIRPVSIASYVCGSSRHCACWLLPSWRFPVNTTRRAALLQSPVLSSPSLMHGLCLQLARFAPHIAGGIAAVSGGRRIHQLADPPPTLKLASLCSSQSRTGRLTLQSVRGGAAASPGMSTAQPFRRGLQTRLSARSTGVHLGVLPSFRGAK